MSEAKKSAAAIMAKHNKKTNRDVVNAERDFLAKSDDAKGGSNVSVFPWRDKSLARVFQPKDSVKELPQIGTRTNIRCAEWDYEVATWFAKNSPMSPNTTHGVLMQAIAIGLESLIEKQMNEDDW